MNIYQTVCYLNLRIWRESLDRRFEYILLHFFRTMNVLSWFTSNTLSITTPRWLAKHNKIHHLWFVLISLYHSWLYLYCIVFRFTITRQVQSHDELQPLVRTLVYSPYCDSGYPCCRVHRASKRWVLITCYWCFLLLETQYHAIKSETLSINDKHYTPALK